MSNSTQLYLSKRCDKVLFETYQVPDQKIELFVVIPAYLETLKTISKTLKALSEVKTKANWEVLILVNSKSNDTEEEVKQAKGLYTALQGSGYNKKLRLSTFYYQMNSKHQGVGMARKLLMDTAFLALDQQGHDGIIVNLDADTIVESNYVDEILAFFNKLTKIQAASIAFEHQLDIVSSSEKQAIIQYELHLRYFINMQRHINLPFAFQTIGSAMAVKASAYAKEGGMNLRQAGEDFYFLQKYGSKFQLADINTTAVHPSGRTSTRVPFGTGKAVADYLNAQIDERTSYHPESFVALGSWLNKFLPKLKNGDTTKIYEAANSTIKGFLESYKFETKLFEIIKNTNSFDSRIKRFYQWFDAFRFFKYLHYSRDERFEDQKLSVCLDYLRQAKSLNLSSDFEAALIELQIYDREINYRDQWRAALISSLSKASAS